MHRPVILLYTMPNDREVRINRYDEICFFKIRNCISEDVLKISATKILFNAPYVILKFHICGQNIINRDFYEFFKAIIILDLGRRQSQIFTVQKLQQLALFWLRYGTVSRFKKFVQLQTFLGNTMLSG